ncbi:MAG: HEPN domain-containing protein [Acutalibacteraceae bacterium]
MTNKAAYWLELADYDLDTAAAMLETKRFLYVGFMCHQCIEKAIKAVIAASSEEMPPKVHNLLRLAEQCGLLDKMNDEQKNVLFILNPLNIESRYPSFKDNLLSQLDNKRCTEIISDTKELFTWIKQQL